MAEPLCFEDVRIDRVYGLYFDLYLSELSAHLNIIHGPNGAGKTTIANALNGLLLPSAGRKINLHAEAKLHSGPRSIHLDVKGPREICRINGEPVDRSTLPQLLRLKSYHLSLQELLPEKAGDNDLAQDIIKQANGGFDIAAAGMKLKFSLQKRYNKTNEAKEFEAASKKLQEVIQEQRTLQEQKHQRKRLMDELRISREATERVVLIEKIRTWRTAESEYGKVAEIANAYPIAIRSSHDLTDVVEKAQKLAHNINQLAKEEHTRESTIQAIRESLAQNRLPPNGLAPRELSLLSSEVRDCSGKYREMEQLQETLEASKGRAIQAWEKLGGHLPENSDLNFTRDHLKRLQEYAKNSETYRQRIRTLKDLKSLLESVQDKDAGIDGNKLRDAQHVVQQWILELERDSPQKRRVDILLMGTVILSAILSLATGIITQNPVGYSGLLISALTFWIRVLLRSDMPQELSPARKESLKKILPELPLNPDVHALQSGLQQLIEKRSQEQLNDLKSIELARADRHLENLSEEKVELDTRKTELYDSLHLLPANDTPSLIDLVDRILHWRELDEQTKDLTRRYEKVSANYTNLLAKIRDGFARHGYESPADPRDAEGILDQLRQDDDATKRDHDRLGQEETALEATRTQKKEQELEFDKIFTQLELSTGDFSGLADCARQYSTWKKAEEQANELRIRAKSLDPCQNIPEEHASLLEVENLEDEFLSAEQEAARERELQEQLTRLAANIERAEQGNSLENALAEKESKRVALERIREEKAAKAIGQVILNKLREDAIKNAPPVFERAQKNFERVTDGRYTLIIPQDDSFRARDNQKSRDFDLTELSSGTRVQLLLSVRLAFVETQESNYRFPITLDETLANSDDTRAEAIIKTIFTLASDRQIFYFTAQEDEVSKWRKFVSGDQLKVHRIG